MSSASKYSAPALDKTLDILECLSSKAVPLSQSEIASAIGRSPNEIYRVLVGLQERRYIVRGEVSGKYRLSLKLYSLAHTHSPMERLREAAALPLNQLAEDVRQSCHLSLLYDDKLIVASQVKSPEPVSLSISEGTIFPLMSTASGRVLLANMTEDGCLGALLKDKKYNALSEKEKAAFVKSLDQIKERNFYIGQSDITGGVTDCAAFVGQVEGGVLAAVAVSGLTSSFPTLAESGKLAKAVVVAANGIRERIGL